VWWRVAPPHNNEGFGRYIGDFHTMSWRAILLISYWETADYQLTSKKTESHDFHDSKVHKMTGFLIVITVLLSCMSCGVALWSTLQTRR
jgi:hypothetical protein